MDWKTIALGADHAGFTYKEQIKERLKEAGYEVLDMGTDSEDSVDYPDFVHPVAQSIEEGRADAGILVCGSGNGVAMTANKHPNIRAAISWDLPLAKLARQHNNANVLALPARFVPISLAIDMSLAFVKEPFEGGRHQRRVGKIPMSPNC